MRTNFFASGAGQEDNLGDSILRSEMLSALRSRGSLHVLVKGLPDAYISGLQLQPEDTIYQSAIAWRLKALTSALKNRTVLAPYSGEFWPSKKNDTVLLLDSWIGKSCNRHGGGMLLSGFSLKNPNDRVSRLLKRALKASKWLFWRDIESQTITNLGSFAGDWALQKPAEGHPSTTKSISVFSFRSDRLTADDTSIISKLAKVCNSQNLRPFFVSQATRDDAELARLAAETTGELSLMGNHNHAAYLNTVSAIYQQSLVTVSDRLHVLLFAALQGSVPVLYERPGASNKIQRTLESANIPFLRISPAQITLERFNEVLAESREAQKPLLASLEEARSRLLSAYEALPSASSSTTAR